MAVQADGACAGGGRTDGGGFAGVGAGFVSGRLGRRCAGPEYADGGLARRQSSLSRRGGPTERRPRGHRRPRWPSECRSLCFCGVARPEAFHRYLRLPTEMRACQGPFRQNKTSFTASKRSSSSIQQSAKHLPGIQPFPAGAPQVPNNVSLAYKFLKRGKKQIKPGRGSA